MPGRTRRGVALLMVLATLVLVTSAAVAVAQVAATEKLRARLSAQERVAIDLMSAAEAPILAWLEAGSATVVLPSDAAEPVVAIMHDAWSIDETDYEIRVTAWDQCGMAPHTELSAGSTLRGEVPAELRALVDRVRVPMGGSPGLDLYAASERPGHRGRIFPLPAHGEPAWFGEPIEAGVTLPEREAPAQPALGAFVATHNPGVINVNTAPMTLVEAAMRRAGRGGIEQVIAARERGEPFALVGEAIQPRRGRDRLTLVGSSAAWAFRIDVRSGAVRRSWWSIYQRGGSQRISGAGRGGTGTGGTGGWGCVQRLVIAE